MTREQVKEWKDLTLEEYEHLFRHFGSVTLNDFVHVQPEEEDFHTKIAWRKPADDYTFQFRVYEDEPRCGLWVECQALLAQDRYGYRHFLAKGRPHSPITDEGWAKAIEKARAMTYHILFSKIVMSNVELYTHSN
jgi:hypothetical protein